MSDPAPAWPILNTLERRILGVLVEKAKTTPEAYPLSLNALVTGCNQKSNRDPIMQVDDVDVEQTLDGLQEKGQVLKVTGGRVDRWRQALYEVWNVGKVELAVLAELLLRGPQTEGELRGRASRMEPIEDLEQLRTILKPLAERKLIVYLTPERSRGTTVTHGFHPPEELAWLRNRHGGAGGPDFSPPPQDVSRPVPSIDPQRPAQPSHQAEFERLSAEIERLRTDLDRVLVAVGGIQQALGIPAIEANK